MLLGVATARRGHSIILTRAFATKSNAIAFGRKSTIKKDAVENRKFEVQGDFAEEAAQLKQRKPTIAKSELKKDDDSRNAESNQRQKSDRFDERKSGGKDRDRPRQVFEDPFDDNGFKPRGGASSRRESSDERRPSRNNYEGSARRDSFDDNRSRNNKNDNFPRRQKYNNDTSQQRNRYDPNFKANRPSFSGNRDGFDSKPRWSPDTRNNRYEKRSSNDPNRRSNDFDRAEKEVSFPRGSASGERVEVGMKSLSRALNSDEDDDELDADVRRSVRRVEDKAAKKEFKARSGKDQFPRLDAKSTMKNTSSFKPRPTEEELEATYGEKIELMSPLNDFFYGKHPISVAFRWVEPHVLQSGRLIVQEGSQAQGGEESKLAKEMGVRVEVASKMRINEVMGGEMAFRPHQGLLLELPKFNFVTIKKETVITAPNETKDNLLMLALDEISDPMNLGAILRSAHFFGVFAVLTSEKNSASISGTVVKSSAGAAFIMSSEKRLFGTRNLPTALQAHKNAGWRVVGTSATKGDGSVKVIDISELEPHPKTILVMGNEEEGMRAVVKSECDVLVHLSQPPHPPMSVPSVHDDPNKLATRDSEKGKIALNVSAATAALLARIQGVSLLSKE